MNYAPIALPFFLGLWFIFALLVVLLQIGILQHVFESMGVSRRYMLLLLVGCLLGSYINIPIATLPGERVRSGQLVDFFGVTYVVPVVENWPNTVVAINVGGAAIPVIVSLYLLVKHRLFGLGILATAVVTVFMHLVARPVAGVGVVVPI